MRRFYYIFFVAIFFVCASLISPSRIMNKETRVSKVLDILGDKDLGHYPDTKKFGVSAKRGESIVRNGFSTRPGGGKTRRQSKHFKCTSCHNLVKEDPDLRFSDPQARLAYTHENGLPFLQGTSLYGAVNRTSFYNGDYKKKYGDLVDAARNDIRGAIQLCATECAQGRKLKTWELESVLAYLWTIDLKIGDLQFDADEYEFVEKALKKRSMQDSAIQIVKSKYLPGSPATFGTAHSSLENGKNLEGNPDNGQLIYENSCLHCHADRKYSYLLLDNDKLTFKHLAGKAEGYSKHSLYQVVRYGVFSKSGKHSYMPQYPYEKMTDQQLEDLKSYIEMRAE